jgi:hypothetical protein
MLLLFYSSKAPNQCGCLTDVIKDCWIWVHDNILPAPADLGELKLHSSNG